MKVLVLYGTSEGQTRKIAKYVADQLREHGTDIAVRNILDDPQNISLRLRCRHPRRPGARGPVSPSAGEICPGAPL